MSTVGGGVNIITDGLVLYLDAANTKSYPRSGTVWSDLSRSGNNGTLTNGPTFNNANGGSIVFDGVDDRVTRNFAINTGINFTVSSWIYPTLLGTTRRAVAANSYNYTTRNGWLFSTAGGSTNNSFFLSIGGDNVGIQAPANILNTNEWVYITATCQNGGVLSLYKNGQVLNGSPYGTVGTITYTFSQFNVGFRVIPGTADPFSGRIAQTLLYNRTLTAQEVLQNYNATKGRFGL
jgi:hypothetical protein